jgi:hypothetical protein
MKKLVSGAGFAPLVASESPAERADDHSGADHEAFILAGTKMRRTLRLPRSESIMLDRLPPAQKCEYHLK